MNKTLILVVEDDRPIRNLIITTLKTHDYKYLAAENGSSAILEASSHNPDIVLLDLGLPDIEGVEVIKKIRTWSNMPIIVISARSEDTDKIEALDAGADDYLVNPVALAVLLKHVEAVLRRTGGEPNQVFYYQDFTLDYDRKEVKIQGQPVALTPKEYGILEILTKNKKKVVTKRMLLEQVWDDGGNFVEENTLHVTLNRLKKKIEPDPAHPVYVKNVFGLGYTFGE